MWISHERLLIFCSIILIFSLPSSGAEDIHIVDIYSDIDSADVTIHSGGHYTDISIKADLIFGGKVLESNQLTIDDISPDTDITKVFSWHIKNPGEGFYKTNIMLSMNGKLFETKSTNFSYGWQALPRIFIKDIIPDSSGISVILAPPTTPLGPTPALTDVEFMLVEGDTVIYSTIQRRVTVVQPTPISKDWNVVLLNNHHYSTRIKARVQDITIAQSRDFTAKDDARITELYRDKTGASATIVGQSQVPFEGSAIFTITKEGSTVEQIQEKTPILMLDDDETIEVIWGQKLTSGIYGLSVIIAGNDGDIVDRWDTLIEVENTTPAVEEATPAPTQTPGFTLFSSAIALIIILLTGWANRRDG